MTNLPKNTLPTFKEWALKEEPELYSHLLEGKVTPEEYDHLLKQYDRYVALVKVGDACGVLTKAMKESVAPVVAKAFTDMVDILTDSTDTKK
jgi:uncharacterized surface protein with fasciclin (FAS1) repeats